MAVLQRLNTPISVAGDSLMKKTLIALVVLAGLIVSGGFFLLTWNIPPPSAPVEKVLPDESFPR
ncbi:MAG TPA: hypothetical protein VIS03_08055 [Kiloniellaceae bacterium]